MVTWTELAASITLLRLLVHVFQLIHDQFCSLRKKSTAFTRSVRAPTAQSSAFAQLVHAFTRPVRVFAQPSLFLKAKVTGLTRKTSFRNRPLTLSRMELEFELMG